VGVLAFYILPSSFLDTLPFILLSIATSAAHSIMSSRQAERDRRAAAAASARTNEYFVPRDGIDREVITADICRYLGNDALVRPGNYENPQTRQIQAGYFINAYRNLTTAMIADLKADSERWEAERRATSGGRQANVDYRGSTTHQSRQYYGPTEAATGVSQYPVPAQSQQVGYDNNSGYAAQQQTYPQPASTGYAQPQGYPVESNYYIHGGNMESTDPRTARQPTTTRAEVPRNPVQQYPTASAPAYQQPDPRGTYYAQQPTVTSSTQYTQQQPTDPYYGRGAYNHPPFL